MYRQTCGQVERQVEGRTDRCTGTWQLACYMDREADGGWMDRQVHRRMADRQGLQGRWTYGQTGGQMGGGCLDRQLDRWPGGEDEADGQTDGWGGTCKGLGWIGTAGAGGARGRTHGRGRLPPSPRSSEHGSNEPQSSGAAHPIPAVAMATLIPSASPPGRARPPNESAWGGVNLSCAAASAAPPAWGWIGALSPVGQPAQPPHPAPGPSQDSWVFPGPSGL